MTKFNTHTHSHARTSTPTQMNESTLQQIQLDISHMISQHIEKNENMNVIHNKKLCTIKGSYFKLIVSSIIVGAIPGLLSAIDVIIHPEDHLIIPIIVVCISCMSSVLLSVIKYRNFDQNILEQSKVIENLNQTVLRLQEQHILLPSKTTEKQLQDTLYAVTHIINPSIHSRMTMSNTINETIKANERNIDTSDVCDTSVKVNMANISTHSVVNTSNINNVSNLTNASNINGEIIINNANNIDNTSDVRNTIVTHRYQSSVDTQNTELEYELSRLNNFLNIKT